MIVAGFLLLLLAILWVQMYVVEGLTPPANPLWDAQEAKMDYGGNDISNTSNITLADCRKKCLGDQACKGIVTDFDGDGPGNCWMKSAFGSGNAHENRFAYKMKNRV